MFTLPATATTKADLEIVSRERPYDSDNPIISKVSPDFKLGKGILTTTYEISSYPGNGVSGLVGWGRVDEQTYIPYLYFKESKKTPASGPIVGQPYKDVATFEITESPGDMLFRAWLNAPSVPESFQSGHRGTQLAAKQTFTIEFQSADGQSANGQSANGAADAHQTAKKWNKKGNELFKQGNYDEALGYYEKATEIDPNYAAPYSNMGWALYYQGNYQEALTYFIMAIDVDSGYAKAWCGKGHALKKLGRKAEASNAIAKSKELGFEC